MKHKNSNGFFYDWKIKVVCLLTAILVFFCFSIGIPGERKISMPLNIELPSGLKVTSLIPETADVVIRGDEGKIYMIDVSRIKLIADFTDVKSEGVASVPVTIDYTDLLEYIGINDLTIYTEPAIVKLYFEKI